MPSPKMLMTYANAPAAPQLPMLPPSGRVSTILQEIGLALGGTEIEEVTKDHGRRRRLEPPLVTSAAYCAFAWRYARDFLALEHLRGNDHFPGHLRGAVLDMARKRRWPYKMRNRKYLHRLIWLALWEEHNGYWIRLGQAWPRLIEMEEDLWKDRVVDKYEAIRGILDGWNHDAIRVANARAEDLQNEQSTACT